MTVRYVANYAGIGALSRDPQMGAAMVEVAKAGQAYAESISPHGTSGRYSSSFQVVGTLVAAAGTQRAGAILINTAPYAHGVEWRNGQHILARTAQYIDGRSRFNMLSGIKRSAAGRKALSASRRRRKRASEGG